MKKLLVAGPLFIVAVVAVVVAGPLVFIWSLNTLFPSLAIPYTIETWAAVALLRALLHAPARTEITRK
ncbi:hypothetical protein EBT31_09785 [bacterium]|jgi:hypothetical protein|nr:hypothetical protein [bacterium]